MNQRHKPGIYVHIPFCKSKCVYCDFYSTTNFEYQLAYTKSLIKEINIYAQKYANGQEFDTIYLGGGTPSFLNPTELSNILNTLVAKFSFSQNTEVTLEINPGTIDPDKLKIYKSLGINRISAGIQSFNDHELQFLGRIHSAIQAQDCMHMLRAVGFENINVDLIYAMPNQTIECWEFTLSKTLVFKPTHISTYNLTIEEGTPLYTYIKNGRSHVLSQEKELKFYKFTHHYLSISGYRHYEVSNFAISEEKFSQHNFKYWNRSPYIGFGPSAHSFWNNERWANKKSIQSYISELDAGRLPVEFKEILSDKEILFEYIFLKLRTYQGLNLNDFKRAYGENFTQLYRRDVQQLLAQNLAIITEDSFKLSEKGMLICDEILPRFLS
jgi:oxygen-independent coproporphyrinogen-3 oxidase